MGNLDYINENISRKRSCCLLLINFSFRYQDKNTAALIMLKASTRWLAFRGNILSTFLMTSVSAGAFFATQSPGGYIIERKEHDTQ